MLSALQPTHIEELEILAKGILDGAIYDFIVGGAGSEWGLQNNRLAFYQYSIIPRVLMGVDKINTKLELLGKTLTTPILIAPCAFHKLVCTDGELASAKAAEKIGTIMTLSTMSSYTIEEVASASSGLKWFQLYAFKDDDITESLIRRAENAGYAALVVTVDVPMMGMRLRDIHNKFKLPPHIDAANLRNLTSPHTVDKINDTKIKTFTDQQFAVSLTWDFIAWLKSITKLPIILKGILNVNDAITALDHNVAAIIVSNHGGRQIDGAESSLNVLPDIAEAINNRIPIIIDGGIRSGEDVFKALALGANAVMIGRPMLWSLALGDEEQLISTFDTLTQELTLAMHLAGCESLNKIHEFGLSLLSGQALMLRSVMQQLQKLALKPEDTAIFNYKSTLFMR